MVCKMYLLTANLEKDLFITKFLEVLLVCSTTLGICDVRKPSFFFWEHRQLWKKKKKKDKKKKPTKTDRKHRQSHLQTWPRIYEFVFLYLTDLDLHKKRTESAFLGNFRKGCTWLTCSFMTGTPNHIIQKSGFTMQFWANKWCFFLFGKNVGETK